MNIFILDIDPVKAAQYHCDAHVGRMVLESAQLLSYAHFAIDGSYEAQKRIRGIIPRSNSPSDTSYIHNCALWVRETTANYNWLHSLLVNLNAEFTKRNNKMHKLAALTLNLGILPLGMLDYVDTALTPFVQSVPETYRNPRNAIEAYREYYFYEKQAVAKWNKGTPTPKWWIEMEKRETTW